MEAIGLEQQREVFLLYVNLGEACGVKSSHVWYISQKCRNNATVGN